MVGKECSLARHKQKEKKIPTCSRVFESHRAQKNFSLPHVFPNFRSKAKAQKEIPRSFSNS